MAQPGGPAAYPPKPVPAAVWLSRPLRVCCEAFHALLASAPCTLLATFWTWRFASEHHALPGQGDELLRSPVLGEVLLCPLRALECWRRWEPGSFYFRSASCVWSFAASRASACACVLTMRPLDSTTACFARPASHVSCHATLSFWPPASPKPAQGSVSPSLAVRFCLCFPLVVE